MMSGAGDFGRAGQLAGLFLLVFSGVFISRSAVLAGDSQGTDFWVAFTPGMTMPAVLITGKADTTGTVSVPGIGFSIPFSFQGGKSVKVSLPGPAAIDLDCTDCALNRGVHVEASCEVSVYGIALSAHVRIYTSRGIKVWEGVVERPYILEWNGCNEAGKPVVPGTYLWVAESGGSKEQGTLIVE